ncbi:transglutaminase-like cysteine peptidase [Chelativorans sp. YIM 93263]|uniref:transglutaminase-like cysteine peptidase n=1 Tax=Chelativorans sp. YIM 93263 TaxID=2906648 RepID=UPI0023791084|nr:transglutaminase-like cysteine peptidase [Chelativorans sp. YIM 93263]
MNKAKTSPRVATFAFLLSAFAANAQAGTDFMATGGITSQPVGHYEFCQRHPEECSRTTWRVSPVNLTPALWETIVEVNNAVNRSVMPRTDMELWGIEEYWSYPDIYGDCEDYVLEKRRRLMEAGIPGSNLLVTVVLQPNGDGHAVLTVNTHMGDYVLDNMEARVLPWSETPYEYLKRQSEHHSGKWVSIEHGRDVLVGSVSQ